MRLNATARKAAMAAAAALLVVTTASCGDSDDTGSNSSTYELRYISYVSESDPLSQAAQWFMDQVSERTNGRVTFKTFYAGSLVPAADSLAALRDGRADIGQVAPVYTPAELPLSTVVSPFMTQNPDAMARALASVYASNEALQQEWEGAGARVLNFSLLGNASAGFTEPVADLGDLDGRSARAVGATELALEEVGVKTVALDANEIYESLQRGVVDGFASIPFASLPALKLAEVAPNIVDLRMGVFTSGVTAVSARTWDRLPQDVRDIMEQVASEVPEQAVAFSTEAGETACEEVTASGATVTVVPEDEASAWKDRLYDTLTSAWRDSVVDAGVSADTADAFLSDIETAITEAEASSDYVDGMRACAEKQ